MKRNTKHRRIGTVALILLLALLFALAGCRQPDAEETSPTSETEAHTHAFVEGVCECGQSNGFEGLTVETDSKLTAVTREDTETGMILTSQNAAGDMAGIRLNQAVDAVYGHYYEAVYTFTSNATGTVRFVSDNAAYYETNEFDVKVGENEIVVRFAAGDVKDGKAQTSLELGGLDKFALTFTSVTCTELNADLSQFFLDVAPEKASGTMVRTPDGHLTTTYNTDEGWRVKLAVDRKLEKGKTYETTFVFTKSGGRVENVTYTVYDGAATMIGSKTKWVDSDLCVATFYFTANETITKGTCLELGQLCNGSDVFLTFTYIDFKEVGQEKLSALLSANRFTGVNVWTEASLTSAVGTQSSAGLTISNTNPATDWWKVKLEKDLPGEKDSYYRIGFKFNSNAQGRIKFVNDDAVYYGSNEYDVKQGENVFTVEIKSGGNTYSCLELGGLGPCELVFTDITVEKIDEPQNAPSSSGTAKPATTPKFSSFHVWTEESMQALTRKDRTSTMTLTSKNAPADWWKIKLEKDITGKAGQCYEVVYQFTSNTAGRIKFINDDALFYGTNEYDVVVGENTFTVQFKYAGNPYSCLELGGLGEFQLVFTNYTIKKIQEPEVVTNGFEDYRVWTEGSLTPATREDTENSMIVTSANAAGDWWKVKVERDLDIVQDHYYEVTYKFTSDVAGPIQFVCDGAQYLNEHTYNAQVGENTFTIQFKAGEPKYSCLELGGLGAFQLVFTEISLTEIDAPEQPEEHTHSFANGVCSCGETNGFEAYRVWTEGSLTPAVREDTENSMTMTSANAAGDWWKVKLESDLDIVQDHYYELTYKFTSDVAGQLQFTCDGVQYLNEHTYNAQVGENTFTIQFKAGEAKYSCLELGGLGAFQLVFTEISLTEIEEPEQPEQPEEHTHSFANGVCSCGETNGFEAYRVWTEGALTPAVREDTENSMTMTSANAAGDWWKVKLESDLDIVQDHYYELTYKFTSDVAGQLQFTCDGVQYLNEHTYNAQVGENTFTIQFKAGEAKYSCLELGGLGAFQLVFTDISLTEIDAPEQPEEHTHSFANGVCSCGETNGFEAYRVWTEGALTPAVREDTENSMTMTSANAAGDWWKVKLESDLDIVQDHYYELTYKFTSDVAGQLQFTCDGALYLNDRTYNAQVGENTFTIQFKAGEAQYSCLELGGLGAFQLVFTEISLTEIDAPEQPEDHTHSFINGVCSCGETNGFEAYQVWTEGSLTPVVREDTENSMTMTSANAAGDWWKVKLELPLSITEGKIYEVSFSFTSNAAGTIKYSVNGASFLNSNEYAVLSGANTFAVRFTAGAETYSCLELGGLGAFQLVFTEISVTEIEES